MAQSLIFDLVGRDRLSRVFDRAGDAADRLRRRIVTDAAEAELALRNLQRAANDRLRDMSQRLVQESQTMGRSAELMAGSLLPIATAAVPAAAALLPLAAQAGAAGAALGAFGAAAAGQVTALKDVTDAQKKFTDAQKKHGAASQQAAQAEDAYQEALSGLPKPTRETAAAFGVLSDRYKAWSDGLAANTMPVFTRGIELASTLLPKFSGLVKGSSDQLNRLVTLAGGAIASPGFDALMGKFTTFANGALKNAVDGVMHFSRVLSEGKASGPLTEIMQYAKEQGPQVKETLQNIAKAVVHLLEASAQAGPGMLTLVNAAAKLVSAIPTSVLSHVMQLAVALKLIGLTRSGLLGAGDAMRTMAARLITLAQASRGAGGALGGIRAAFNSLSAAGKASVVIAVITGVALAVSKLSSLGQKAAPDVDKMTTALGQLGRTGKASGEASRVFGKDLDNLRGSIEAVTAPSVVDHIQQGLVKVLSLGFADSTPTKKAREAFDSIDQGLANLVKDGNADQAAAALERLKKSYSDGGKHDVTAFTDKLKDYKSALADAKFAQDITADSMGLFGQQAVSVQAKLDTQKRSADGLRQSIQALNQTNRDAYDAETKWHDAIASVSKGLKDNGKTLSLSTEKGRANRDLLSQLASATEDLAAKKRQENDSWKSIAGVYDTGRRKIIAAAEATGMQKDKAKALADQLLKMPDKTVFLKGDQADLKAKLADVSQRLKTAKGEKYYKLLAEDTQLREAIAQDQRRIDGMHGKSVTIGVNTVYSFSGSKAKASLNAAGSLTSGGVRRMAAGGTTARQAMIAPGGSWILWAEEGDEAYIPLDRSRRPRSRRIAEATVRALGGAVAWMAGGGIPRAPRGGRDLAFGTPHGITGLTASQRTSFSKAGRDLGGFLGKGFLAGIMGSTTQMQSALKSLKSQVTKLLITDMTQVVNQDNAKLKTLAKERTSLVKQLGKAEDAADHRTYAGTGRHRHETDASKRARAAAEQRAADLRKRIRDVDRQEGGLRKEIGTAKGNIRTGTALTRMIDADNKKLSALAKQRDAIAAKIAQAKQAATDFGNTARQSASLSSLGEIKGSGDLKAGLQSKLARIQQFTSYIKTLAKRGLNKSLLQQVLQMGPEQGLSYASALAGADKATFSQINSIQAQIDKSSTSLGQLGADALYDAGSQAGKGYLAGLAAQQKAIEDQMVKIAKGMEKAIKAALGIKSPSRVTAAIGRFTVDGLGVGMLNRLPQLHAAVSRVAGVISGTSPEFGAVRAPSRAPAARSGGPMQVDIHVHGVTDPVAVGREFRRILLELKRTYGGIDLGLGGIA